MLHALPHHDSKWIQKDLRSAFSEDGLLKLWTELSKDGEIQGSGGTYRDRREQEAENVKFRTSPFDTFLTEWTWGEEPSAEHLREALHTLVTEQQELSQKAAHSTLSLGRLHQRLIVMERYLLALNRKGVVPEQDEGKEDLEENGGEEGEKGEVKPELPESKEKKKEEEVVAVEKKPKINRTSSSVEVSTNLATVGLARVGARAALSFAFAFLKRAWYSGEDSELCTDVLQEALEILQNLPVALLFDTSIVSEVWLEVVDRSMKFLMDIQKSSHLDERKVIPLGDRQIAMSLLLELALQRGTLSHILDALLLLLRLSDTPPFATDKNRRLHKSEEEEEKEGRGMRELKASEMSFPLVPFLRRLSCICTPPSPFPSHNKKAPEVKDSSTPSKCYLECHTLPNDDTTKMDLRQVATMAMAHLDRIAEPYNMFDTVPEPSESVPVRMLHWGVVQESAASVTDILVELGPKQVVVLSEYGYMVLTTQGTVYNIKSGGEVAPSLVQFPGEVEITQLAYHPLGKHFLALSSVRNVYAWGSGDNGELGLGESNTQEAPTLIGSLSGKNVVYLAAGAKHSAAVTEDGLLFTWGKGSYGRLGHGNVENKNVPTHVEALIGHKIIDVDCGSDDAHTLALEKNGTVWSWGDGGFGKLGHGNSDTSKVPKLVQNLQEVVKVKCGPQFSIALTRDGVVYSWGCAEYHHLGHGDEDHIKTPKLVAGLVEEKVVSVAVGSQHVLALAESGNLYGWGKNSHGEVEGSAEAIPVPLLLPAGSNQGVMYIECGPHESIVFCEHQRVSLGRRRSFCLDVTSATFEKLDLLLRIVCEGLNSSEDVVHPSPKQDHECMAIATLNLLKLQLYSIDTESIPPGELGLTAGSPLLSSLKQCVVQLARNGNILPTVQQVAQRVLQVGWRVLLPTVAERATALLQLLPSGEASVCGLSIPNGHHFMIDLLVKSLMSDQGLENALTTAIAYEAQDPAAVLKAAGTESSVPLIQLIQHLVGNSTARQLAFLKQAPEYSESEKDFEYGESSSIELLLQFQRLLLGSMYCHSSPPHATSSSPMSDGTRDENDQHIQGAMAVLVKYISMLHHHVIQVLPVATQLVSLNPHHFKVVSQVLKEGPVEALLPELSVGVVLLQLRVPMKLVENRCVPLLGELVKCLDDFNRLGPGVQKEDKQDLDWPDTYKFNVSFKNEETVTQRDKKIHHLEEDCEVDSSNGVNLILMDTERTLALLEGLRACFMVQGLPVLQSEEDCEKWLSMEIFSSGMETQALSSTEATPSNNAPLSPELLAKSFQRRSISGYASSQSFICGLMSSDYQDEKVALFLFLVQRYCRQKNLYLPHHDQNPNHPIETFGRLFMACLIKLHDLVPDAMAVLEQEGPPNNEQDSTIVQLPQVLADVCKLVYEAKVSLVKAHQESLCSYEEVCQDPIARCRFLIDYIRSPSLNVINVLHKHQIQSVVSRWRTYARRVLDWKRSKERQAGKAAQDSVASAADGMSDALLGKVAFSKQTSIDVKHMKEAVTWDEANPEIASGRKFKWLRERRVGSTLLNQIKNFILAEEVDIKLLDQTLKRQVMRANSRLEGTKFLLQILNQDGLLDSVKYSVICGWLGVVGSTDGSQQSVAKPHYLCNVEHVYPNLRTLLELKFQELNQWMVNQLRSYVWEAELTLKQTVTTLRKRDIEKGENGSCDLSATSTVGVFTTSRFIIALLGMLTSEHDAVDISALIDNGFLGLSQTVMRLAGTAPSENDELYEEIGPDRIPYLRRRTGDQEENDIMNRIQIGTRIVQGPDWKWGDQDGPAPSEGTVISELGSDNWIRVRWDTGAINSYRMTKDNKYDLTLAPSELEPKTKGESKDVLPDAKLTVGMATPFPAEDMATSLILQSSVCLLRSVVVAFGIHSHRLPQFTSSVVSRFLHHIMQCAKQKSLRNLSVMNVVASQEKEMWATLGFLRGVSSPKGSGVAFSSPQWIELLMDVIRKASPLNSHHPQAKSLIQQVLTLRLLRSILPSWEHGHNTKQQQKLIEDLFSVLGQVLVLCSSPFVKQSSPKADELVGKKYKKLRFHASSTASESSTIAEEVVVLLRRLHPLPAWNDLINQFIGSSLQAIPSVILASGDHTSGGDTQIQLQRDVDNHGPVLAVLTVIGGLDTRPRLGGLVQHGDLGMGTIAKVESKGKVIVLFHGWKKAKMCTLAILKQLPVLSFLVDHLPMSETVMGIWSSLVRLAGSSGTALMPGDPASLFQPPSKKASKSSVTPVSEDTASSINVPLLRQEQIRLGLLKAARVLFSQQQNLLQIMAHPTSAEGDQFSLFQQLLSAATRPSTIKAMFSRDELEAAAVSVCQFLASEVHKPLLESTAQAAEEEEEEVKVPKKKPPPISKKTLAVAAAPPAQQLKPNVPPPSPVVIQLMEMGFERGFIEYAMRTTSSNSPERLINWLVDHQGMEVPEEKPLPLPAAPVPPPVETTPPTKDDRPTSTSSCGSEGLYSESSSDSSDDEDYSGDLEVEEEVETSPEKKYKTRDDFSNNDEYARYIRDNITVGIMIRCCDAYEEVRLGDIGRVMKVDNDGLHDLNVQANWQQKGGTYWVRFGHCELLGDIDAAGVMAFKAGDRVRVKRGVTTPKYKWGSVTHQSVGVVRSINRNGTDVCVDFPEQNNWTGLISEMEIVPGIHPRHRCTGCYMTPIEGPRFHCQVCADFDYCQGCFDKGQSHNHAFERVDDQGHPAVYVGSPRSRKKALKRKKKKMQGGSVVMDWDQIVRHVSVSSNEAQAYRLMDGIQTTYWQSSGTQGKHWIRMEMQPNILIEQLSILVEQSDSSYMPNVVVTLGGSTIGGLKELKQVTVPSTAHECTLISGCSEHYPIIEIAIRSCKSGGIDTKIHGINIIGRVNMNEEEVAASFSFLTVEEAEKEVGLIRKQRRIAEGMPMDGHSNKVFVWGLNDHHQLGTAQSDAKIKIPTDNKTLGKLNPLHFAGGSRTLFVISQDGKVYSCGEWTNGRLGTGGVAADVMAPKVLGDLSMYVVRKVAVNAGGRHAMALTADGKVFSWGDGEYGQLGHGDNKSYSRPKMIESLQGKHVKEIACGSGHSAAITTNGELYTWGQGEHGRLGHGDTSNQSKPKQVKSLESQRVTYVACGSRDAQTLAATENGQLWAWGDGAFGKLGKKDLSSSVIPVLIKDFGKEGIVQLECGTQFSVLLTKDGKVYTWGKGEYYRLGTDNSNQVAEPQVVENLSKRVTQIAVGSLHCLALTENGEVYAWGDNEHGQQGSGSTISNRKPTLITALKDYHITKIACGSSHSVAYASGMPPPTVEFTPISFPTRHDPLGTALTSSKAAEEGTHIPDIKRPSLTRIILSLATPLKRQEALSHVLTALQIAYARDAIANSLGGVASTAKKRTIGEDHCDQRSLAEISIVGVPSQESGVCPQDEVCRKQQGRLVQSGLDDFTSMLTVEDARVMVDLLKLAVANRVGEKGKETLGAVLTAMGKANPKVSIMLMELCISELEDVAREPQHETPKAIIQESPHPYPDNFADSKTIRMPGAEALIVTFDLRCSTERRHDVLVIKDGGGAVIAVRSGRDSADWAQDIRVIGDELTWSFKSDGSVNGWGFMFTIQPIMPKKNSSSMLLSDRALQSRPSIDLVTCLLDFQLGRIPNRDTLNRLGAALASCAQLSTLDASQRMWAIQHLRKLIDTANDVCLTGESMASLHSLVGGLPGALMRQYHYEIPHVTGGSQLLHHPFFQSMIGLACDMMLDTAECCKDPTKWAWFHQYCTAAHLAKALLKRTTIPQECLTEVNERIESLKLPQEDTKRAKDHEDHRIFWEEHDEQLLLWTQRYPKDWSIPLGNSFSIYGWGHNHRGQLGGVEGNKVKVPRLCENFSELNPVQIIGGEQTMFAVTSDGKVYSSGYGAYGRLGIGGSNNVTTPTAISSLATRGTMIKKLAVHSGGKHCLAITTYGELYSWGEGDDGKLGLGGTANMDTPHLIDSLKGKKVVDAACGSSHSSCILDDGSLYTWGKGRYGRLGHNDHEPQHKPKQVMSLKSEKVICVALGSGDAQSLCACASGNVYSWGDGDYGKLGRGGNEGCKTPKKIPGLCGKEVVKMLCGSQFSIALTKKGHVYTWGKGDYFRLGHGDDSHQRVPKRVMGALTHKEVVDISCGSLHCLACTSDGKVYAWGDNDEGQIGNDSTTACQGPHELRIPDSVHIDHVTCGSAHSIAWSSVRRKIACKLPDKIPMEFNHLQDFSLPVLRNRLILLHHFSNLFCKSLSLFGLQQDASPAGCEGMCGGYNRLRFILLSSSKEAAFRRVIKATMSQGKQHGPCIELNRLQVKRSRPRGGGMADVDGSRTVFGQMCSKWNILSAEDLLLNQRIWKVKFVGESVDDCGGGYSESIAEMCDELQNGSLPLLIQTPNGRDDTGVNRDCFIINPAATSHSHLNMFRFLGALMGIAVRTGSPINLSLAPPVWKQLVGLPLSLNDLSEIDSDYVNGLIYIRDNPEGFVGIEFMAPSATGVEVSLHHSWTHVTLENVQEYVRLSTQLRLHEFDKQIHTIREGMSKVIPVPLLSLFTGPELETMVCGSREISISLLKSVTTYKGIDAMAPLTRWFWEVMESFNQTERSLFLRFVWGRTRLPRTAADFRGRDFVLQILDKYHPPDYYLPESYTCFFLLKLPRYSCKPVLEEKLRYAINFCKSIDTDDYARVNLHDGLVMDDDVQLDPPVDS